MTDRPKTHPATEAAPTGEIARFGERLHHLRQRLGLSAEGFAQRLGLSDQAVYRPSKLEAPYPRAVKAIRSAFPHVRPEWLTRNEGPVFSSPPPHGLEEQGRSVCLSLEGPGGEVLARVELVLPGRAEPVSLPMVSVLDPFQASSSSAGTH